MLWQAQQPSKKAKIKIKDKSKKTKVKRNSKQFSPRGGWGVSRQLKVWR
jgi:hypothetical protein